MSKSKEFIENFDIEMPFSDYTDLADTKMLQRAYAKRDNNGAIEKLVFKLKKKLKLNNIPKSVEFEASFKSFHATSAIFIVIVKTKNEIFFKKLKGK